MAGMPRYALKIEYHGAPFAGWQRQSGQPSVQQAVETALRRLEAEAPGIGAAGRTDSGVHATGQVAHCDLERAWQPFRLMEALNHHLKPAPVAVVAVAAHGELAAADAPVEDEHQHQRRDPLRRKLKHVGERREPDRAIGAHSANQILDP